MPPSSRRSSKNIGIAGALAAGRQRCGQRCRCARRTDARRRARDMRRRSSRTDADLGGCRNTIVVLIVGGGEGTISPQDLAAKASTFLNVNARRVPIYVVALFPEAERGCVAAGDRGQQRRAVLRDHRRRWPTRRRPAIPCRRSCAPSTPRCSTPTCRPRRSTPRLPPRHPFGLTADWQVTSPIVGTVNLRGASKIGSSGSPEALPDSETYIFIGHDGDSAALERARDGGVRVAGLQGTTPRVSHLQARRRLDQAVRLSLHPGRIAAVGQLDAGRRLAKHLHDSPGHDGDDSVRRGTRDGPAAASRRDRRRRRSSNTSARCHSAPSSGRRRRFSISRRSIRRRMPTTRDSAKRTRTAAR